MKVYRIEPTYQYSGGLALIAAHSLEEAGAVFRETRPLFHDHYSAPVEMPNLKYRGRRKKAHELGDWTYLE